LQNNSQKSETMSELNFKLKRIDEFEYNVNLEGKFCIHKETNVEQMKKDFEELMMKYAI